MSDLTLPLIGLTTLVGYFFSKDGKNPRETTEVRQSIEGFDKSNGSNIYTSNKVEEVNKEILERSMQNYKKAESPSTTGFIPPLFNIYSQVGKDTLLEGVSSKELAKINEINRNKFI
jgi:hypothetical protein